ncbi:MAG: hypothetical protein P3T54_05190 [Dehalogenimonas sp.]|jgi:hypothetical protein|uniref:Uncharacterized protein n=1 Tax=Candidatus Dehalogenimonas loeffleri TaxID=3127115 RepID=A0ABZ2J5W1_9CHLR|nr:hypothetical protein [Dehalogenimonas sp.]
MEINMSLLIGITAGLMDGLGISLWSSGQPLMGIAWVIMGLATAGIMYLRVRPQPVRDEKPDC